MRRLKLLDRNFPPAAKGGRSPSRGPARRRRCWNVSGGRRLPPNSLELFLWPVRLRWGWVCPACSAFLKKYGISSQLCLEVVQHPIWRAFIIWKIDLKRSKLKYNNNGLRETLISLLFVQPGCACGLGPERSGLFDRWSNKRFGCKLAPSCFWGWTWHLFSDSGGFYLAVSYPRLVRHQVLLSVVWGVFEPWSKACLDDRLACVPERDA